MGYPPEVKGGTGHTWKADAEGVVFRLAFAIRGLLRSEKQPSQKNASQQKQDDHLGMKIMGPPLGVIVCWTPGLAHERVWTTAPLRIKMPRRQ